MSDLTDAVAAMNALVAQYSTTRDQIVDWGAGSVDGGPNNTGDYPITNDAGVTLLMPCPAKILSGVAGGGYTNKAAAASAHIEASTDVISTSGWSTAGDGGGAAYIRVDADPALGAGSFQTADGAFWRYAVAGPLRIEQFGGKADCELESLYGAISGDPTDNLAAFNDMMKSAIVPATGLTTEDFVAAHEVQFGTGIYYFSAALEPRAQVNLKGQNGGSDSNTGTIFRFPERVGGIVINQRDTGFGRKLAGTTEDPFLGSAQGSTISDIYFLGGGGVSGNKAYGLWMRTTAKVIRCTFDRFADDNIRIVTSSSAPDPANYGNANGWYVERCLCRSYDAKPFASFHVSGGGSASDANAGLAIGLQIKDSGGAGIIDDNTLGNTYIAPEVDGYASANSSTGNCWHDGMLYNLATVDTDLGGATEPGTNESVWWPAGPAAAATAHYPAWVSGGDYSPGGPMYIGGPSNCTVVAGGYSEGGTSFMYEQSAGQVHGGQWTWARRANQLFTGVGDLSGLLSRSGIGGFSSWTNNPLADDYGSYSWSALGVHISAQTYFHFMHEDIGIGRYVMQVDAARKELAYVGTSLGSGNPNIFAATLKGATRTFGRSVGVENVFHAPQPAFGNFGNERIWDINTAAPTSGEHAKGEIVWNNNAAAGGVLCWRCVASGSPGTWEAVTVPADKLSPQIIAMSAVAASHTGDTAETTLATITIPGGTMGANGRVQIETFWSAPANTNVKTLRVKAGGEQLRSLALQSAVGAGFVDTMTGMNRNATNSQFWYPGSEGQLTAGNTKTTALDTTVDQIITLTAQCADAADTITLEAYIVRAVSQS